MDYFTSFIVDIEDDVLLCYTKNNTQVNKELRNCTNIIYDVCNVVSEYYNCIIVHIEKYDNKYSIHVENEYINFEHICHKGGLMKSSLGDIYWYNHNMHNQTIITDHVHLYLSLQIFNMYIEKQYKIQSLFNCKKYDNLVNIKKDTIYIARYTDISHITILNHDLFTYLILMYKKILDTYEKN